MLTDGTFTASSGGSFTVTTDSTIITTVESAGGAADAAKYAADASTMAVGDVIRIGGATVASPVYVITAITIPAGQATATITLNMPYQGTSGTVVAGNVGVMSAITAWGIKLTGLPLTYTAKGLRPYKKVFYNLATVGFTSTLITASTRMTYGQGVWQQVSDLEWFALGGDGIRNYMWHPIPEGRTDVVSGTNYNTITLEFTNTDEAYVISGTKPAKALVYLFIPGTIGGANQVDDIIAEINTATGLTLAW
jgi:hypothetical protein